MRKLVSSFCAAVLMLATAGYTTVSSPDIADSRSEDGGILSIAIHAAAVHLIAPPVEDCFQQCDNCEFSHHSAKYGSGWKPDGGHSSSSHGCYRNSNSRGLCGDPGNHKGCDLFQEDEDGAYATHAQEMRSVFERLVYASPVEVVDLVAAHPSVLSLNRGRSALQVTGSRAASSLTSRSILRRRSSDS